MWKRASYGKNKKADRAFWGLSLPIMLDFLMGLSIPAVDSLFLAKMSLDSALAVGAVLPVLVFCDVIYGGYNQSAKGLAAQALGAKDQMLSRHIFSHTLVIVCSISILLFLFFFFFSESVVNWIGLTGNVAVLASEYLLVMGCGFGLIGLRFVFQVFNALYGIVKFNLISTAVMLGFNALGNAAIVYDWWGLGVFGIQGIAYVSIGAVISGIAVIVVIQKIKLGFVLRPLFPMKNFMNTVQVSGKIAIPSIIEPASMQLFFLFFTAFVSRIGDSELAIRVFSNNIFLLCMVPGLAMSIASQIIAAKHLGSNEFNHAEYIINKALWLSIIITTCISAGIYLFGTELMSYFTDKQEVLSMVALGLIPLALIEPVRAINTVVSMNLKSAGDGFIPTFVSMLITWCIVMPVIIYAADKLWFLLLLWLLLIDEVLRCLYNVFRWKQGNWKLNLIQQIPGSSKA